MADLNRDPSVKRLRADVMAELVALLRSFVLILEFLKGKMCTCVVFKGRGKSSMAKDQSYSLFILVYCI